MGPVGASGQQLGQVEADKPETSPTIFVAPGFLHRITVSFHSTGKEKSLWNNLRPYGNPNPLKPKFTSCSMCRGWHQSSGTWQWLRGGPLGSTTAPARLSCRSSAGTMGIVSSSGPHESPPGDLQEPKGQRET